MKRHLWVVEMKEPKGFMPTVCVALNRVDGCIEREELERNNPSDKFQLVKYGPINEKERL